MANLLPILNQLLSRLREEESGYIVIGTVGLIILIIIILILLGDGE